MMGVHVANSEMGRLYFVIDPTRKSETGALVMDSGEVSRFNFWGWVSANPEIEKLENNEFQELLWNEPLPQDEELWDSYFFSRTAPLSGIIDQGLLENVGTKKKPQGTREQKQGLAMQIMERSGVVERQ